MVILAPLAQGAPPRDRDRDGLSDRFEHRRSNTRPDVADTDHDGIEDGREVRRLRTNPRRRDTDHDGLSDGAEVRPNAKRRGSPLARPSARAPRTDPRKWDTDGDGLSDGQELLKWFTDPTNPDSDGDGISDGAEVKQGSDPLDPLSPAPVDTTPPETTIVDGPSGSTSSTGATFAFGASEPSSFACRVDAGTWSACSSPKSYSSMPPGPHQFDVRATDAAGNVDATPAERDWSVSSGGLVAAYGFEEPSGATATDLSGRGNTGAIAGAAHVAGRFGNALAFDGIDDLVTVADSNSLDLTTGMTLEAWVKPSAPTGWQTVLLKEQPGHLVYALYGSSDSDRPLGQVFTGTDSYAYAPTQLPAGVWSHVAATWDGSALNFYVDGVLVSSRAVSGQLPASTGPLVIGGNNIWGEWFRGSIDDVRVYNRALGELELLSDRTTPVLVGTEPLPVDTSPPDTTITSGPTGTVASASASFSFSSTETGSRFECRLDGGAWSGCSSPKSYSGLSNGTHSFEARAVDGTGNVDPSPASRTWTVNVTSAGANLVVSTTGSDANPCTAGAPCRTFDRAYHVAAAGDVVEVAGGSYPDQVMSADGSKTGPGVVTFRPAAGANVTLSRLYLGGASYVKFRDIDVSGRITVEQTDPTTVGSTDVTFENTTAATLRFVGRIRNITVRGGEFGNTVDNQPQVKKYNQTDPDSSRPFNVLVEDAYFHDFTRSGTTVHTECFQVINADTLTIRGSRFNNCDGTGDIGITDGPHRNITLENNFFGKAGDAYHAVQMTKNQSNLVVRNNSASKPVIFSDSDSGGPYTLVGNYFPFNPSTCTAGATYSRNVFAGGTCGPTDLNVPAMRFVDVNGFDLHLAPNSEALNRGDSAAYPAADIDGQARPMGGAPDAGADEAG